MNGQLLDIDLCFNDRHTLSNNRPFSSWNSAVTTSKWLILIFFVITLCEHESRLRGRHTRVLMHHSVPAQLANPLSGVSVCVSLKTVWALDDVTELILQSAACAAVALSRRLCFSVTSSVRVESLIFLDGTANPHSTENIEPKGIVELGIDVQCRMF